MAMGRGQEEKAKDPPTLSLFLSSTFFFLCSPFRATVHYPLSSRLVFGRPESFFKCRCKGSIDVHLGAFDNLKAHTDAATIPALACVKRHFLLQRKVFGHLFLPMVFHRRSKRVKIFSETFVTKYLISVIIIRRNVHVYNYLKEKTRTKKESVLIS